MAAASIVISQSGVVGAPGQGRDDIVAFSGANPVELANSNDNGVTGWRWRMVSRPTGSAAALSNVVAAQPTFEADVPGTYLVELSVNEGLTGEVALIAVAVRNAAVIISAVTYNTRYIGAAETIEANWEAAWGNPGVPNDTGWWEDLDQWLHMLQALAAGGGGGGGGLRFDNRAAPASVDSFKVFSFVIDTGGMTTPLMHYLRFHLVGLGGTITGDVRAYTNAGLTNLVYEALGRTLNVGVGHEDGTPAALFNSSALIDQGQLTAGLLYVTVTLPAFLDSSATGNLYLVATEAPIFGA